MLAVPGSNAQERSGMATLNEPGPFVANLRRVNLFTYTYFKFPSIAKRAGTESTLLGNCDVHGATVNDGLYVNRFNPGYVD